MLSRLVPLTAGIVYVATAARGVIGGDSGELVAAAWSGGVAHPPGYPLYVLWLRAFSWLPAASPAHAAALATAVLGAIAVAAVDWAARAWGARRSVAALAAALYAFGPLAFRLATEPEVFALNVVLAMLVVGLSAPAQTSRRVPLLLGLVAGLGLSNHHSIVLLAPIGIYGVLRFGARGVAHAAGGLALGLLPYAYLVVAARGTPLGEGCLWGDTRDLGGLLHHFLRADYGTVHLAGVYTEPEPKKHIALLVRNVVLELAALPVLGLFAFRRDKRSLPLLLLGASLLLAGPVFVSRFNLPPSMTSVIERFHLLPTALACVLMAIGIERVVGSRERLVLAFTLPLALVRAGLSLPAVQARNDRSLDAWIANVATMTPEGAIVVPASDGTAGALLYARCATKQRPDLVMVVPSLLFSSWYPKQLDARLGITVVRGVPRPDGTPTLDPVALVKQLAATDRALFLDDWIDRDPNAWTPPSYPLGPLLRVVPAPEDVLDPDALYAENVALSEKLVPDFGPRRAAYARPWRALAGVFGRQGDPRAAECADRARRLLAPR